MNRHARRSDMRTFRRAELLTHCVAADDVALERHKLLKDAAANFHLPHVTHRPFCIACRASFITDDAKVDSYLFAMPLTSMVWSQRQASARIAWIRCRPARWIAS